MNIDHGKREWTDEELWGLREDLDAAREAMRWSRAELARQAQIAASTFSQFMSGDYKGDNGALALTLSRWLDAHREAQEFRLKAPPEPKFVQTRTASEVQSGLQYAQLLGDTAVIVGPPGVGKTAAQTQYAMRTPRVFVVTASPAVSTPSAVLASFIARYSPIHNRSERSLMARSNVVRGVLSKGALMVVDEAQHLTMAALEELRAIHDATGCGLVLMGNQTVLSRIQGASRDPAYAQIFGRVGKRIILKKGVEADVAPVLETMGITAPDVIAEAVKIGKREDLRVVVKATRSAILLATGARENVEPKHIRAAYRNLAGEAAA